MYNKFILYIFSHLSYKLTNSYVAKCVTFLLSGSWVTCYKNHSLCLHCLHLSKPSYTLIHYSVSFYLCHSTELALAKVTNGHSEYNFIKFSFLLLYMIPYPTHFAPCFLTISQSSSLFDSNFFFVTILQSFTIRSHLSLLHRNSVL